MTGDGRIRLFCALQLPPGSVAEMVAWQREHRRVSGDGRLVPAENLHVTLAFLGLRPTGDVPAIGAALAEAAAGAAPAELRPLRFQETRSVGMIVCEDPAGTARLLAAELTRRLKSLGVYRGELRPWLPHVTVVRFAKSSGKRWGGALPIVANIRSISVVRVALYASALRPTGAQYDVLETVALGGR